MWVLLLNDMRAPKVEILSPVVRADTREALEAFLKREEVEAYTDGRWGKVYRKGGPLEWFNRPWDFEANRHFVDAGTREESAFRAAREWDQNVLPLPKV